MRGEPVATTKVLRLGVPPVLELPGVAERVQQLRNKLQEYQQRSSDEEARYKALILGRLLEQGSVATAELTAYVQAEVGPAFNRFLFNECCNVIDDYCRTG